MSTDGEVANALVCKTSIHGFKSHSVLHKFNKIRALRCGGPLQFRWKSCWPDFSKNLWE